MNIKYRIAEKIGRCFNRIRRTYKDFLNLVNYISKEFQIVMKPLPPESDNMIYQQLEDFLKKILRKDEYNKKLNLIHYFLEISFITFLNVEECAVKQISVAKKSGQKKMKTLAQELMTCFEYFKKALVGKMAHRNHRGNRLHHKK